MNSLCRFGVFATVCFALAPSLTYADNTPPIVTHGQAPSTAQAYSLRYKFFAGDVLTYSLNIDTDTAIAFNGHQMPLDTSLTLSSQQTVQSVNPINGSAVLVTKSGPVTGTMNGQPLPAAMAQTPAQQPVTMTITPTGGVLNSAGIGGLGAPAGIASSLYSVGAAFPSQSIRPGDAWVVTVPIPSIHSTITSNMILKNVQQVAGDNIAEIDGTFTSAPLTSTAPVAATNVPGVQGIGMSGTSVLLFDIDKGIVQSMSNNMKMAISVNIPGATSTQPMQSTMALKMTLVPPTN